MYMRLGSINIWPSREQVKKSMPISMKEKYPNVRCIIDCVEFKVETPSSLFVHKIMYSEYKSHTTVKALALDEKPYFSFFQKWKISYFSYFPEKKMIFLELFHNKLKHDIFLMGKFDRYHLFQLCLEKVDLFHILLTRWYTKFIKAKYDISLVRKRRKLSHFPFPERMVIFIKIKRLSLSCFFILKNIKIFRPKMVINTIFLSCFNKFGFAIKKLHFRVVCGYFWE